MTEYERWLWIADVAAEHGALCFLWQGSQGVQPVLMPGYKFLWWLDDTASQALHQTREGDGSHRSGTLVN